MHKFTGRLSCPRRSGWRYRHFAGPLGKRPWLFANNLDKLARLQKRVCRPYLAITVGPKVNDLADNVVERGVRALIHDDGGERQERHQQEAELDALVHEGASEGLDGQLEREHGDAEDGVDDLQDR